MRHDAPGSKPGQVVKGDGYDSSFLSSERGVALNADRGYQSEALSEFAGKGFRAPGKAMNWRWRQRGDATRLLWKEHRSMPDCFLRRRVGQTRFA
jgi:hypothetical protein